jgi:hypothetical protein
MTQRRALFGVGVLMVLTIVTTISWVTGRPPGRPGQSPQVSPGASAGPTDRPGDMSVTSYEDSVFDPAVHRRPTGSSNQSKLWFAAGTWWATMIEPERQELRIARLDGSTQHWVDTGVVVDTRPQVRAAVAWDGKTLAVVTAGAKVSDTQSARFATYHLDAASNRFLVDSDLPISLTASGLTAMAIGRDATGVLWLAGVADGHLLVRHTLANDQHWTADLGAAIAGADGAARTASIAIAGGTAILAWNRPDDDILRLAIHRDGAADDAWSTSTTSVGGLLNAPGDLSVVATSGTPEPRLFVAFQTAPDADAGGSLAPGAVVVARATDGTWSTAQLGRAKDHLRDPILAIDEARNHLLVFAESDGQIVIKPADLDHPAFESGPGRVLIPATGTATVQDPSTASGPVDLASGVVVLAADSKTGRYLHGIVALGSPVASPSPSAPGPSSSPTPEAAAIPLRIDRFDPWAVDERPPTWTVTGQSGGRGRATVAAVRSATNRSLRISTTSASGAVRACASFPPTTTGTLTITSLVRIGGGAGSDTTIGSIRGPGGEAASLRITRHNLIAFYRGATKVTTTSRIGRGAWYRTSITIHVAARTWDWSVATATGRRIVGQAGVAWRQPDLTAFDTVCGQAAEGIGSTLLLDDVTVTH